VRQRVSQPETRQREQRAEHQQGATRDLTPPPVHPAPRQASHIA